MVDDTAEVDQICCRQTVTRKLAGLVPTSGGVSSATTSPAWRHVLTVNGHAVPEGGSVGSP